MLIMAGKSIGINESKMRAYKSGVSYPSEKTTNKIFKPSKRLARNCLSYHSNNIFPLIELPPRPREPVQKHAGLPQKQPFLQEPVPIIADLPHPVPSCHFERSLPVIPSAAKESICHFERSREISPPHSHRKTLHSILPKMPHSQLLLTAEEAIFYLHFVLGKNFSIFAKISNT
jgi:hypothetical protein